MFGRDGLTARSRALEDSWFLKPSLPSLPIELYPSENKYDSLDKLYIDIYQGLFLYDMYQSYLKGSFVHVLPVNEPESPSCRGLNNIICSLSAFDKCVF